MERFIYKPTTIMGIKKKVQFYFFWFFVLFSNSGLHLSKLFACFWMKNADLDVDLDYFSIFSHYCVL